MTDTCPECGAHVELEERPISLRSGSCASCHRSITFLPIGEATLVQLGQPAEAPASAKGATAPLTLGPMCDDCGERLLFAVSDGPELEGTCPKCGSSVRFVAEAAGAAPGATGDDEEGEEEEDEEEETERPRGPRRGPWTPRPGAGFAPRTRPCRQCGGPLRFSTGENGLVTGVCDSCGNTFTLPPRAEGRGGSSGFRTGFSDRGGPRGRGGPSRFSSRGPPRGRGFRPGGRGPPRFRDRREDDEGGETRRRRRPRREE